jgi:excisionase family DNA binding protein
MADRVVTREQAAKRLRCSMRTVERMPRDGRLGAVAAKRRVCPSTARTSLAYWLTRACSSDATGAAVRPARGLPALIVATLVRASRLR